MDEEREQHCMECGRSLDDVPDYLEFDGGYVCTDCNEGNYYVGDEDF